MARHYFNKKGYSGSSFSTGEVIAIAEELGPVFSKIIGLVIAGGVIYWLGKLLLEGIDYYVFGYNQLAYPHKATGFFYFILAKFLILVTKGPYVIGEFIYSSGMTPWININLIFAICISGAIYISFAIAIGWFFRLSAQVLGLTLAFIIFPGFLSLFYAFAAWFLGWLFYT